MKDLMTFAGLQVIIDLLASLSIDKMIQIICTIITLILAVILFALKLKRILADGKVTPGEKKEIKESLKDTAEVVVCGWEELEELIQKEKELKK